MLTLGQASKATGISKTAIARAASKGRLSASRNELGEYQIDPAELFRVYPPKGSEDSQAKQDETPKDSSGLQAQIEILRELVRQIESERDDLRERLDRSEQEASTANAEARRLTLMITDQRQKEPSAPPALLPTPAPKDQAPPFVHPFLWFALGATMTAAAALTAPYWWPLVASKN